MLIYCSETSMFTAQYSITQWRLINLTVEYFRYTDLILAPAPDLIRWSYELLIDGGIIFPTTSKMLKS